jgi:hypothetical protein
MKTRRWACTQPLDGFSLAETVVALGISCLVGTVMLAGFRQQMQWHRDRISQIRAETWRERVLRRIHLDVNSADQVSASPLAETPACNLEGRLAVLHLWLPNNRTITYSVGDAPSPIWRDKVLMRCSSASSSGAAVNQVVIDGLARQPGPWLGCEALLKQPGIDLAGSSTQAFSACRPLEPASSSAQKVKTVAVRLKLQAIRSILTHEQTQSERLLSPTL